MARRGCAGRVGVLLLGWAVAALGAEGPAGFDGRPWNVSSGNASVTFIQASPIGAFPRAGAGEEPPAAEVLKRMRAAGLVAYEDYVAWGAVERAPGTWDWAQHDRMERAMHAAGLKYVVYDWVHFPPVWLRNAAERRTLMRCAEHGQETNYLSIFDPRTIEWYDHFYKALREHFGDRMTTPTRASSDPTARGTTRCACRTGWTWGIATRGTGAGIGLRSTRSARRCGNGTTTWRR